MIDRIRVGIIASIAFVAAALLQATPMWGAERPTVIATFSVLGDSVLSAIW
jgi:hypothetical protein